MSWKKDHANEAERFAEHELVEDVLTEFASNMGFERKGLPEYWLHKIVVYVAQVVLARARGFEPELLLLDDAEIAEHQRRLIEMVVKADKPVTIVAGDVVATIDGNDRPESGN